MRKKKDKKKGGTGSSVELPYAPDAPMDNPMPLPLSIVAVYAVSFS